MVSTINDNPFSLEAMYQPYEFFRRLREWEPVHYNEEYEVWMVSSWEHLVWVTRHPEVFSSSVFARDTRPPNPPIDEDDMEIYNYIRNWQVSRFIQHDQKRYNPGVSGSDHVDMRRVMHSYFTPKSMEMWRPLVQSAITELLDVVEEKGRMDVMADLATPLPLLVIARMLGIPDSDRPIMRKLAKDLRHLNRTGPDRMGPLSESVQNLQDYLGPLVAERVANPKDDLISVVAEGERRGIFDRDMVINNVMLLLVSGPRNHHQPHLQRHPGLYATSRSVGHPEVRSGRQDRPRHRGSLALRLAGEVHPAHRHGRHRTGRPDHPQG